MQTAPAGLRRMRELRNCHIKGNFVTETALSIGAVETNTLSGVSRRAMGCLSNSRNFFLSVQKEIREQIMQESPSGMASASQADSGGFDSRFLLQENGQKCPFFAYFSSKIAVFRGSKEICPQFAPKFFPALFRPAPIYGKALLLQKTNNPYRPKLIPAGALRSRRAPRSERRLCRFLLQEKRRFEGKNNQK